MIFTKMSKFRLNNKTKFDFFQLVKLFLRIKKFLRLFWFDSIGLIQVESHFKVESFNFKMREKYTQKSISTHLSII